MVPTGDPAAARPPIAGVRQVAFAPDGRVAWLEDDSATEYRAFVGEVTSDGGLDGREVHSGRIGLEWFGDEPLLADGPRVRAFDGESVVEVASYSGPVHGMHPLSPALLAVVVRGAGGPETHIVDRGEGTEIATFQELPLAPLANDSWAVLSLGRGPTGAVVVVDLQSRTAATLDMLPAA